MPASRDALLLDALLLDLRELAQEWRERRGVDTDATHAVRIGCAEQLAEIIDSQLSVEPGRRRASQ